MNTFSGKGLYSQQQLKRLDSMLSWPELQQQSGDPNPQHDLSQLIWNPEVRHEEEEPEPEASDWWSMNNLFALASRWKYWLAAALLPSLVGVVFCLARVVGLTTGYKTDARMGGVGIANTLTSLLCHSYM